MAGVAAASSAPLPAVTDGAASAAEEASPEELLRDAEQAFGEIFSVRAPRDVLGGLWSGIQCVLSGVMLGVAGLITQPIEGARGGGGVGGCFRGVAIGLCTGLFFSITGLCTGMFQAVRGVVATPRALCMASQGWRWDGETGTWHEPEAYTLTGEAEKVLGGAGEEKEEDDDEDVGAGSSSSGPRKKAVDTYYYDQLGLQPTASQNDIRRAYFQQSRKWHPDKSTEPQAKEKFQAISEAYQVLSDPARRRAYDAQGREGAGEGFVDAQVFFDVLLGADALEPYIGRLRLAEMFGEGLFGPAGDDEGDLQQQVRDMEQKSASQVKRQVRLAVDLVKRLESHTQMGASAFHEQARGEARGMLQKDAAVERFVNEVGWVYKNRAELYLARDGSILGSYGARALQLRISGGGREASQKAHTAKLAVRSFMKLRKIVSEADGTKEAGEGEEEGEEQMPGSITDALPTFMETFWSLTAHDIADTLHKVVERVLSDTAIDASTRRQRAEALRDLGDAFMVEAEACRAARGSAAAGSGAEAAGSGTAGGMTGDNEKCRRFEEAFARSVAGNAAQQRPYED